MTPPALPENFWGIIPDQLLTPRLLRFVQTSLVRLCYQLPLAPPPPELVPPPKLLLAPQAPELACSCCLSRASSAARTAVQFRGSPLRTCCPQRSITSPVTT